MDLDGLFSGSKWEIIEHLSRKPSTLSELAKDLKTSVANVSQQVRFLEFAGIVLREKSQKSTAGKPENLLKLSKDFSYIVVASGKACRKNLVFLDAFQSLMLYSWVELEGKERESFEVFLFENKKDLEKVEKVYASAQITGLPRKFALFLNTPEVSKKNYGSLDFLFFDSRKDSEDAILSRLGKKDDKSVFNIIFEKRRGI